MIYLFEISFLHKVRHFASSIRLRLSYSESGSVGKFGPGPQRRVFQPDSFPSCLHSVASISIPVFAASIPIPVTFLCRSRSRIRVLPLLDKRQAPQLGRTVKRIYTKFKLDRKQQGCFPRFPKDGATIVVSELGKVVRRPMRSSGQVPLEISWCVPDVPGIFLHLIQNSTSYQNRKPGSRTPSSVVPPEFPCSSHRLRA